MHLILIALTFLLIASASACKNSFVLSGSWPATIFTGFTLKDFPVTAADEEKHSTYTYKFTKRYITTNKNFQLTVI